MTKLPDPPRQENTYFIDPDDATEMARLLDQDYLLTQGMGGLFPERTDNLEGITDILDVACGPGGWVLDVARHYPNIEVTGIDIAPRMITYAQAHAGARQIPNAHFKVMNALQPMAFADASFCLVNARLLVGLLNPDTWPVLLRELLRVCRPGGTIRLTEFELAITNSPAFEEMIFKGLQAMGQAHLTYSPSGRSFCITPMLEPLLRQAGCQHIEHKVHSINSSSGTPAHEGFVQDMMIAAELLFPFLERIGAFTRESFDRLHQLMVAEMLRDDFVALSYGLTVWGTRP